MERPNYLYCYFDIERGIEFLKTQKFRLSSFADFNDPFEALFRTDYPLFFITSDKQIGPSTIDQKIKMLKEYDSLACSNRVKNKLQGRLNLMEYLKIGCFSEIGDNILMWSHY